MITETKLLELKAKARKEGWAKYITNENDERALLEGCWFDHAAAKHVTGFISDCIVAHDNTPLVLLDWQHEAITKLFGWKRPDNTRRFRQAGIWIPKKNGKSFIISALVIYTLVADREPSAQIYSLASSLDQGKIIFNDVKSFVDRSPALRAALDVIPSTKRIVFERGNAYYQVLPANPRTCEGWNIHACFFDELHTQRFPELFQALRYGGAARKQPLCPITISTAGIYDPTSLAWQQYSLAKSVQTGSLIDTSFLPVIYEATPESDIDSPATWRAANPSIGKVLSEDDFRRDVAEAKATPQKLDSWKRYRLNVWQSATSTWLGDDVWRANNTPMPSPEVLAQIKWFGGLDMASTTDVTAFVLIGKWQPTPDGPEHYVVKPWFWVNEEQATMRTKKDQINYVGWIKQGIMEKTPGAAVDQSVIRKRINEIGKEYQIKKLATDPWNASQLAGELDQDGFNIVLFDQRMKNMSGPTKELERLLCQKRIIHGNNEVLHWMYSNVQIIRDTNDNIKMDKKRSKEKIDGMIAWVQALAMLLENTASVYESRGIKSF